MIRFLNKIIMKASSLMMVLMNPNDFNIKMRFLEMLTFWKEPIMRSLYSNSILRNISWMLSRYSRT